jgi:raffinose/stachyose/melibiose transport system substrate-binding protein
MGSYQASPALHMGTRIVLERENSTMKIKGHLSIIALLAGAAGVGMINLPVLAAASPAKHTIATASLPKLAFHGTITMYAQVYEPVIKGVNFGPGSPHLQGLNVMAAQFHKLYPNIHIKFYWPSLGYNVTPQWQTTEAAAGEMPDIFWQFYSSIGPGGSIPASAAYNLAPYFNQPNPFIPGNKAWKNIMPSWLLSTITRSNGSIYELNGDAMNVGFFYNKTLFKKAGLSGPPKTWVQLVADAKQLKAHGINPGADVPQMAWWDPVMGNNFLGPKVAALAAKLDKQFNNNGEEVAADLYRLGYENEAKNPAMLAWWPVLKELYQYWNPAQTAINANSEPSTVVLGTTLFEAGKTAMVFNGTWNQFPLQAKFPVGAFLVPSLKGTSPYASSLNTYNAAGGPADGFEFGISSHAADHTMTPAKFKAALAWLQFIGTPQHDQYIVNNGQMAVPTFKGTTPAKSMIGMEYKPVGDATAAPWALEDNQSSAIIWSDFDSYLDGQMTFKQVKASFETAEAATYKAWMKEYHWKF